MFTDRKIQGFPIVFLSVNLSIRSIIWYFPITVNPEKACFLEFTGLLTLGECLVCLCSQMFSRCKASCSPGVYNWKPTFSLVFQNGKCRGISQNTLFTRIHCSVNVRKAQYIPTFTEGFSCFLVFSENGEFKGIRENAYFLAFTVR